MKYTKQQVLKVLRTLTSPDKSENIVDSGGVQNIHFFGDETSIDVIISNPSLQAKKRIEVDIIKALHDQLDPKMKVSVNVRVEAKTQEPKIKGKEIDGISNIIAFASGKGGVGKSTVAVNVAVSLAKKGLKVGFLDADIYGPSAPIMFDMEGQRPLAVKVNNSSKMEPIKNHGVKVLSIGFFTGANQAVIWRGPMAAKALNQMIFDANWGELDFLVIDLPPGTGDIHLSIMQSLPLTGAVIVSTPQNVALADARKGVAMFRQKSIEVPILGFVENMSYFNPKELPNNKYYIFGKGGARTLAKELDVPFLGEIPIEQSIREGADKGVPITLQKEEVVLDKIFDNLTKQIVEQTIQRNENLRPSERIKITTMSGCNATRKN